MSGKKFLDHPLFGQLAIDDDDKGSQSKLSDGQEHGGQNAITRTVNAASKTTGKILEDMKREKMRCRVQEQGCKDLLENIPSTEGEEYRKILLEMGSEWEAMEATYNRIANEGGIQVILEAMSLHKTSAVVQENGCHILRFLSRTNENEEKISDAKGIEAIVDALSRHKESVAVQTSALRALWNFIFSDENKLRVQAGGGTLATIKAMQANK